jgi:signal transduction histidine kinase/DNA-binding response OmpR family regulator/HPt (histidine-containing phosphotransfer) domain-containing protein
MRLFKSTTVVLIVTFLILAIFQYSVFQVYLLKKFSKIEDAKIQENIQRFRSSFDTTLDALVAKTIDWAQWDDTYYFMNDKNQKYIDSMIVYETISPLRMNHILYFDKNGKFFAGWQTYPETQELKNIQSESLKIFQNTPALHSFSTSLDKISGFFKLHDRVVLLSAVPVTDSKRESGLNGSLVFTQHVSHEFIESLSTQTKLKAQFFNIGLEKLSNEDQIWLEETEKNNDIAINYFNQETAYGYTLLRDIFNKPVILLKITQPRIIYNQGLQARNFLVACLIFSTITALIVTLVFLNRKVLRRMLLLNNQMAEIAATADSSKRLHLLGRDELAELTGNINTMLQALDASKNALEAAKNEAVKANLAKTTFIAKVSHELRTPIHGITGMHRILLKEIKSLACRNYLKMAQESAYSLLRTINDILDFSKAESGNLALETIEFDLKESIREVLRTISPKFAENPDLELLASVQLDVPNVVLGDPVRLKQVLINLLGNASKFTKSGYVKLTATAEKNHKKEVTVKFTIKDTGIGIPHHKLKDIFEPFKQADDTITRQFQGTGLGLTIVQQIVDAMSGKIWVESIVGEGTSFFIEIPFTVVSSEEKIDRQAVQGYKILVIDEGARFGLHLRNDFEQYDVISTVMQSSEADLINEYTKYQLIIVTYEAYINEAVQEQVELLSFMEDTKKPYLVVIVPHQEINIRERLNLLQFPVVLSAPVITDDVLLVLLDQSRKVTQSLQERDNVELKTERPLSILVADDTLTNRIILENMLKDAGHNVTLVVNGQELLEEYANSLHDKASTFDLILTDVQMPYMDGLTATKHIRDKELKEKLKPIKIVTVTAHVLPEEKKAMLEIGVDNVIGKPINPPDLAALIKEFDFNVNTKSPHSKNHIDEKKGANKNLSAKSISKAEPTKIIETEENLFALSERAFESMKQEKEFLFLKEHSLKDIFDLQSLYRRSGSSIKRTKLLLDAFLKSFEQELEKINFSKLEKNNETLRFQSHYLKGILWDVGAIEAGEVAHKMEEYCSKGDFPSAAALIDDLNAKTQTIASIVSRMHI